MSTEQPLLTIGSVNASYPLYVRLATDPDLTLSPGLLSPSLAPIKPSERLRKAFAFERSDEEPPVNYLLGIKVGTPTIGREYTGDFSIFTGPFSYTLSAKVTLGTQRDDKPRHFPLLGGNGQNPNHDVGSDRHFRGFPWDKLIDVSASIALSQLVPREPILHSPNERYAINNNNYNDPGPRFVPNSTTIFRQQVDLAGPPTETQMEQLQGRFATLLEQIVNAAVTNRWDSGFMHPERLELNPLNTANRQLYEFN
jgi:hypothetical protein